ncbi:MAG: CocE/NonD family hydrolase, partial [Marmoricola sp.]
MRITRFGVAALALLVALLAMPGTAPALADAAGPNPFGHACTLQSYGVRFCPTADLASRVPSFDGAPMDVDVTLPATGTGPWPTIIMAPPTLGSKATYETTNPNGSVGVGPQYSNVWYADQGYAVVTYSMRGTFNSCGTIQSRQGYPAC